MIHRPHLHLNVLILLVISISLPAKMPAQESPAPKPAPARVKIKRDKYGLAVVGAKGDLLRGASIGLYKYAREAKLSAYIYDESYWELLKQNGFNSIRAVFFDPWQRSHGAAGTRKPFPHTDLKSAEDVAAMLKELDYVVDKAAEHQMYVMLNYHDTGGYTDPSYRMVADKNNEFQRGTGTYYLRMFWKFVAKRYADRTHVFYELTNEPVKWTAEEYSDQDLANFKKLHEQVRGDAPDTHIVMLSFANPACFKGKIRMLDIAGKLKQLGIDFKNESVGYHPYNGYHPAPNPSRDILALKRNFAVINTEQNFPKGIVNGSSDPDASGLDGDYLGVESHEKFGISWFHWQCDSPKAVRENFMRIVIPDAKTKGYDWRKKSQ